MHALTKAIPLLLIIFIALFIERLKPAQASSLKAARFNLVYTVLYTAAQSVIEPLLSVVTVLAINAAGGGWIVLPAVGWMVAPAFLLYALTLDFFEYLFHRAQHRLPFMWRMHSLHHSDTALNASTTSRHYWIEPGIKAMTIYLAAGILFKTNPLILGLYAGLCFYNIFTHMNLRLGFGRWSVLMNSPQYHRIHHSRLPEHYNANFAQFFPVFDRAFGTCHMPREDEYPPTGLDTGESPSGLAEAVLWPVRSILHR
jgi:sterol desaturase/sphingolipid hydroxylase (fatty acid hydroxylase superfamily)